MATDPCKALIFDPSLRDDILRVIWEAHMEIDAERDLAEKHDFKYEDFRSANLHNQVVGVMVAGEIAGGSIMGNGKFHLAIKRKFKSRWFIYFKPLLSYAFEKYGSPLTTSISLENTEANRFAEQVKCHLVGKTDKVAHYLIVREEMYYGRTR